MKDIAEIKKTPDQRVDKHKWRVVLVGAPFAMPEGTFGKTFAPTPLMATTRVLVTAIVQFHWIHETDDVDNAYLESVMKMCWRVPLHLADDKRT